ncbi:MAG: hypothetical protein CMQ43_00555 [Gammaproteobacteria bacterium]|nr:hypothetical protein [Gammaproteobacteria bacterium]
MVPAILTGSKLPRTAAAGLLALAIGGGAATAVAATTDESLRGPDVTIIAEKERTIYEFRQNGELRMVRVVPAFGKPYYLVPRDPTQGFGDLERADMLLPSWVIVEF